MFLREFVDDDRPQRGGGDMHRVLTSEEPQSAMAIISVPEDQERNRMGDKHLVDTRRPLIEALGTHITHRTPSNHL